MAFDYFVRGFWFLPDITKMAYGSLPCRSHGEQNMKDLHVFL